MESSLSKAIISILILCFIGFFTYKTFVAPADSSMATNQDQDAKNILDLALKLNSVSINPDLFNDSLFTSLKDFTPPLLPEAQGRPNPFASFSSDTTGFANLPTVTKK